MRGSTTRFIRRRRFGSPAPLLALLPALVFATPATAKAQQGRPTPAEAARSAAARAAEAPGWLGIGYEIRWIERGSQCEPQVRVESVLQGSPAERAGLRAGDAIIALDGEPLTGTRLEAVARGLHPGDPLRLRVARGDQLREITAVADRRPARPPAPMARPKEPEHWTTSGAPVVELDGETLIARAVEVGLHGVRGYWLSTGNDRKEYRPLGSWRQDELDDRVTRLLRCARDASAGSHALLPRQVELQQLQKRADSLRVVITRRAMAPSLPPAEELPGAPSLAQIRGTGSGTYILRLEDHLAAELRGVGGAELTALEPELAAYFRNVREGLLVLRVADGSAAARAGLRPGDVIVEGDGRSLRAPAELRALLARPDSRDVRLRVVRDGRTGMVSLTRSR